MFVTVLNVEIRDGTASLNKTLRVFEVEDSERDVGCPVATLSRAGTRSFLNG